MLLLNIERHYDYRKLLASVRTIAVVGLSPKQERPSNMVARYLLNAGYNIIPVNPGQDFVLGLPCYGSLLDIPIAVDLVDIFRRSEDVYPIVQDAVTIGASVVWMQQGITHQQAAEYARAHGLTVVMDRCIKIEHLNFSPVSR